MDSPSSIKVEYIGPNIKVKYYNDQDGCTVDYLAVVPNKQPAVVSCCHVMVCAAR